MIDLGVRYATRERTRFALAAGGLALAVDGVVSAEPILAALVSAEIRGMRRTLFVIGIDRYAPAAGPRHVIDGVAIPRGDGIIVDRAFARRLHLGVGDAITIAGHHAMVVGISTHTNMLVTQYAFAARDELLRRVGVRDPRVAERADRVINMLDGRLVTGYKEEVA